MRCIHSIYKLFFVLDKWRVRCNNNSFYQNTQRKMTKWVKTITTPFRKARTFFNNNQQSPRDSPREKKSQEEDQDKHVVDLQGEVMACGYEDVQVMWSILDKSKAIKT
ncbi:hypothetical protein T459_15241 [Capsicum annuum]|uniref:Uncharacterized protein n=1 Tax=Capsicum annuum TaxID=4072 RepID=A0A2G2ZJS6_CAPAN|nr:putative tRNA pseudouridine synthase-like 1-like [Capsicum annuum]PHT82226.1 hypothetical protein T459_15241 [Capsicum annuum]